VVGRDVLLDAGPLIAMLSPRDAAHGAVREAWPVLGDRCLTTEAVVVEATHIVARGRGDHARVLEFLVSSDIPVVSLHLPLHETCVHLMRRYADVPMDYADATLVALADRLRLTRVFTLDRKGFRTYRGARGIPFEVVPAPA
jgi:hypothetical protein